MIQRKQTLFLLAVSVIAIILFFLPFQKLTFNETIWPICLMPGCSSDIMNSNIYVPMILNILIVILSLVTIFLYKNRKLQFKLANLLVLFNMFLMGAFFLLSFIDDHQGSITFQFGAFLPILGASFAFLAAHFIKKDELLVRNADRIR